MRCGPPVCCTKSRSEPPCVASSCTSNTARLCLAKTRSTVQERKIRKVLVIDGVELALLDQAQQVRKLEGGNPGRLEESLKPVHEVVQIGHVRQHVIGDHQIRTLTVAYHRGGRRSVKERIARRYARLDRELGHISCGLHAQGRNPPRHEVLQQVSIVARDLDDLTGPVKTEPLRDVIDITPGMRQPAIGVRGEVRIIGKDGVRVDDVVQLHEQALAADDCAKWKPGLRPVDLLGPQITVRERHDAEIDHDGTERSAACAT